MKPDIITKYIVDWIKNYCKNHKIQSLVIGISGGIDSALTSTLCAMTNIKTFVVSIPIHQNKKQLELATKHIAWLQKKYKNVNDLKIDISNVFDVFKDNMPLNLKNKLGLANTRARLRMTTLYQVASSSNGIVVGTGNKIEDFCIGFFTKYGDGGVDISPIGDLLKSEVFLLSKHLNIIKEIQDAEPTDGLWDDNRNDEEQIGATYKEIEWAMKNLNNTNLSEKENLIVDIYKKHNLKNQHKMLSIPVCIIKK
tara:strand:- start:3041 stop:3799 length:759 start_codon:yes stop_codon:yes gene_type:complete